MKRINIFFSIWILIILCSEIKVGSSETPTDNWLKTARIAGGEFWTDISDSEIKAEVDRLAGQGINAIETDLSWDLMDSLDQVVDTLSRIVNYTHQNYPETKIFTYIAPLELISPEIDMNQDGKVDPGKTSIFTEHPEWLQIGIDGRPAVFYGSIAFWIGPYDEDVWLCPNDPRYKKIWTNWVIRLTETGIDGLYIDVPFFISNFGEDWNEQWACHCSDCANLFFSQTGYHIPSQINWNNPIWRKWMVWRYQQITNFINTIRKIAKGKNPDIKIIVEHWDGMSDAFWTACSPIELRKVSDVRTHEWVSDEGTASNYHYYSWLNDLVWFLFYRGIDKQTPSWILSYADENDIAACKLLAATVIASGCNFWETEAPDMAGSVDSETRKEIFTWLENNENLYYQKSIQPYSNVGLYYSKRTLDFYEAKGKDCISEFVGLGMMLLESHIPYEVIIDKDLSNLTRFSVIILPNTACLSDSQVQLIENYVSNGGIIIATGETSLYNEWGLPRNNYGLSYVLGINHPFHGINVNNFDQGKAIFSSYIKGSEYFYSVDPFGYYPDSSSGEKIRNFFLKNIWSLTAAEPILSANASRKVIFLPYQGEKEFFIRILNYADVSPKNASPSPQNGISLSIKVPEGMSVVRCQKFDFLGNNYNLNYSYPDSEHISLIFDLNIHSVLKFISGKKGKKRR
ncbi:MAG: hypothetical protein ACE5WD_11595 [Candidatus Aminicenantia bacterium]